MIEVFDLALHSFDNRDIASIIWLLIFSIILFITKNLLEAFTNVIKAFFQPQLLTITLLSIIYFQMLLILLLNLELWDITRFKDSIYWYLGFFIVNVFNFVKFSSKPELLKDLISKNLKFIILFEFFINFHSLELWQELLLMPLLIFFSLLLAYLEVYSDKIENSKYVKTIISTPLLVIVCIYLCNTFLIVYSQIDNFLTFLTLKKLLLPIILIILSIPFLYLLSLYSLYESFFQRFKYLFYNNIQLQSYAKRQIFLRCLLNISQLNRISSSINRAEIKDISDFDAYIKNHC